MYTVYMYVMLCYVMLCYVMVCYVMSACMHVCAYVHIYSMLISLSRTYLFFLFSSISWIHCNVNHLPSAICYTQKKTPKSKPI